MQEMRSNKWDIVVHSVVAGSPAYNAGIIAGDIITKWNGIALNGRDEFERVFRSTQVGDVITVNIIRKGITTVRHVIMADSFSPPYRLNTPQGVQQ
jgi:serine protease Do